MAKNRRFWIVLVLGEIIVRVISKLRKSQQMFPKEDEPHSDSVNRIGMNTIIGANRSGEHFDALTNAS